MNKLQTILDKYSTGKIVLILFIITQIVYFSILQITIPQVMEHSNGMELLDMKPTGYSSQYVNQLLDNLGEEGRNVYLFRQIPLDMIYPALFAITYSLLLFYLFKKGFKPNSKINKLVFIPALAGFFDYLENVGIIIMINIYPNFVPIVANITNVLSVSKSLFTTLFYILLFIGITKIIIKKLSINPKNMLKSERK